MNGDLLQRCFVNIIYELLEEDMKKEKPLYPTNAEFAREAFPHEGNPAKIWQAIKFGQKEKPRGVSIEDAFGMAKAFGEKLDRLLIKAEMRIESGWHPDEDIFFNEELKKKGRPRKKTTEEVSLSKKSQLAIPLSSPQLQPPENGAAN